MQTKIKVKNLDLMNNLSERQLNYVGNNDLMEIRKRGEIDEARAKEIFDESLYFAWFQEIMQQEFEAVESECREYWEKFSNELNDTL